MRDVKTVSELLSLTPRQVYDRIEALSPYLPGHVTSGRNGRKLLDEHGFTVFRRLVSLEAEGLSREAAVKVIATELGNGDGNAGEPARKDGEGPLVEALRARIEDQGKVIEWQRGQIERLELRVSELLPLALPSPRRSLWARILGR